MILIPGKIDFCVEWSIKQIPVEFMLINRGGGLLDYQENGIRMCMCSWVGRRYFKKKYGININDLVKGEKMSLKILNTWQLNKDEKFHYHIPKINESGVYAHKTYFAEKRQRW